ncbi:hypothetical protein CHUAL_012536 [Chamberlinius hualienensis]
MFYLKSVLLLILLVVNSFAQIQKTYLIDGHLKLTWKEAMDKCRQSGMTLVSIDSKEEAENLKKVIEPTQNFDGARIAEMDYWTAGMLADDGRWVWASTGRPFVYTNWAPGSPSDSSRAERCMKLWGHHHLQWDDTICNARLHYICQRTFLSPNMFRPPQSGFAFPQQSGVVFPQQSGVVFPQQSGVVFPQQSGVAFPSKSGFALPPKSGIVFPRPARGIHQLGPQFQDGRLVFPNQFVQPVTKKKKVVFDLPFEEGHILDPDDFTTTTKKKKKVVFDLPFEEGHILDPDDFTTTTKKKKVVFDLPFEEGHILDPDDFTTTTKKKMKVVFDLPFEEGHILDPDDFTTTTKLASSGKNNAAILFEKPIGLQAVDQFQITMHSLNFFIFPKEMLRWLSAKEFCLAKKMDLALVANEQELCKLTTYMKKMDIGSACFWIRELEVQAKWNKRCNHDSASIRNEARNVGEDSKGFPGHVDRLCALLSPSKDEIVARECWIKCGVICENVNYN